MELKGWLNESLYVSALLLFCERLTTPNSSTICGVAAPLYGRDWCMCLCGHCWIKQILSHFTVILTCSPGNVIIKLR
jgi:hypothetical protein